MDNIDEKIIKCLELSEGMRIDLEEGWRKAISRQSSNPFQCAYENIQNLIDSYPGGTPWQERRGEIVTGDFFVETRDFGEGMDLNRLPLILTLGGTDKQTDSSKLGFFGIGFVANFNPKIGTQRVVLTTKCEGHYCETVFQVTTPGALPEISIKILDTHPDYSTCIRVEFNNPESPKLYAEAAKQKLKYLPCPLTINGIPNRSVWRAAEENGAFFFNDGHCDGFFDAARLPLITLLCKYQEIGCSLGVAGLINGGHNLTHDIRDYARKEFPYLPSGTLTVNCNTLHLTISRDSHYLDDEFTYLVQSLARVYSRQLNPILWEAASPGVFLANQFILRKRIRDYLAGNYEYQARIREGEETKAIAILAEKGLYRVNGRQGAISLLAIYKMRSAGLPLFISPCETNINWLNGHFKNDGVVIPPHYEGDSRLGTKPCPGFYDILFEDIFGDVVNLDSIHGNNEKIQELVDRDIIDPEALEVECTMVGSLDLSDRELFLLSEIREILADRRVMDAIARHLFLPVERIIPAFFETRDREGSLATGLFEESGLAFRDDVATNINRVKRTDREKIARTSTIFLGLRREHPFIQSLIKSRNPLRAHYGLGFIANELTRCQRLLVPFSPYSQMVKHRLAADMRHALMARLMPETIM